MVPIIQECLFAGLVCISSESWRSVGSFSEIYRPAIAVIVAVEQVHCTGGRRVVYNTCWLGIGEHKGRVSYYCVLCVCGVLSVSLCDVYLWRAFSITH